jgi:excisionase family DNA binding protein
MMMTVPEVAAALKISLWKTYRLIEARELGYNRIGGSIRVSQAQFADYLKRTERPPRVPAPPQPPREPFKYVSFEPPRTRGASRRANARTK